MFNLPVKELTSNDAGPGTRVTIDGTIKDAQIKNPVIPFSTPQYLGTYIRRPNWPKNTVFVTPEYDLPTIANAIYMDSLLNRSVTIFVEQILKNGFEISSKDDNLQRYAKKRVREIERLTGKRLNEVIAEAARQLVSYGNAYIIKVHKANLSRLGDKYKVYNKEQNPIVGLFVADATTIEYGIDQENQVRYYKQFVNGDYNLWRADEVIHITYNRVPGTFAGQSNINQCLDDLRALRKLEEEIEILGFQYSIPLYLYKVGTDQHPAQPHEVDAVKTRIDHMPTYGIVVVPHTHDMTAATNNNDPIDIMKFVEHFKRRIYAGLGVSPIAMGESESSNRNTAEVLDLTMQTITKSYQQTIKNKIEQELLFELLLDGKFNPEDLELEFNFPEIDLEAQIKKETQEIQKYQNGLITRTEARLAMEYEAEIDDLDTIIYHDDMPVLQEEGRIQKEVAAAKPVSGSAGGGTRAKSKSTGNTKNSKRRTSNSKTNTQLSRPTNQHGTSAGRPKIRRDALDHVLNRLDSISINLFDGEGFKVKLNKNKFKELALTEITTNIPKQLQHTVDSYCEYYHVDKFIIDSDSLDSFSSWMRSRTIDKVDRLITIEDEFKFKYFYDSFITSITSTDKLENIAKILILRKLGKKSILFNASDCAIHSNLDIELSTLDFNKILPNRHNCLCKISDELFEHGQTKE